ncbi:SIMPL domain-containing protein [Microbulbifer sp. OS29]|uniref:SIMPL domain-containing protein n=1 Tax=Microbulbifer okhotskensis TaxID=2926617 RepID=A0A9X2EKW4_9GAMM|nr:SIMPL domain-containing protein [Microbulbifer okhotskensis]MCO1334072.1 SIMPL domain-containing protein [Microbulbifer okhotskensis]
MKAVKISVISLLSLVAAACGSDHAPDARGTMVSIAAHGEASQVPDIASISVGVVTESEDSKQAMRDNANQMESLMAAIKKSGIAKKDIQTSGVSLSPRYQHQQNKKPVITGYTARNTVRVKVRKLDELGKVLDNLTAAGANRINGPSFEIGELGPVQAKAREKALQDAQERADIYAKALGTKVRRIVSISENGNGGMPRPMYSARAEMATMKDNASTPIAPGETTLSVNLNLVYELED